MSEPVTHYNSSKGPIEIASMPLRYATNAIEKLKRECGDGSRDDEIRALADHIQRMTAAELLASLKQLLDVVYDLERDDATIAAVARSRAIIGFAEQRGVA